MQDQLICRVHGPDLLFQCTGLHWVSASSCHVLWLLSGYLQPLALSNHHDPQAILVAGSWMGGFTSFILIDEGTLHFTLEFLWLNHQPFLLWYIIPAQPCPQRYVNGRDSSFHSGIDYSSHTIACGDGLLLLHSSYYNADSHSSGQVEMCFNLCFSHGSCYILRYCSVYLCPA